jgi:hypothetical protein
MDELSTDDPTRLKKKHKVPPRVYLGLVLLSSLRNIVKQVFGTCDSVSKLTKRNCELVKHSKQHVFVSSF